MARRRVPKKTLDELRKAAADAAEHNYARYSNLLVVASVETTDGAIFGGTNIEVANFTLTKHAEEMAIMRAIATLSLRTPDPVRDRWLRTLYVSGAPPCGSCRQFASEWAVSDARCVIDLPAEDRYTDVPLQRLLPETFGAEIGKRDRPARPVGGALPKRNSLTRRR